MKLQQKKLHGWLAVSILQKNNQLTVTITDNENCVS